MIYLYVHHKVKDYAQWKKAFDGHAEMRKASGSRGGRLFKDSGDPNEVTVLLEWDSLEQAQKFVGSENLQGVMNQAGVMDEPQIFFLEKLEDFSGKLGETYER